MRAHRLALAVVVLVVAGLLLAPGATAGTEAAPEVDDHPDFSDRSIDLLAAWLEPAFTGTRVTVKVGGFSESGPADRVYYVGFELDGETRLVAVAFDADAQPHTIAASPNFGRRVDAPEDLPDDLRDVKVRAGEPAYVSFVVPWGAYEGFEPGAEVTEVFAGTAEFRRSTGAWDDRDMRNDGAAYVLERALLPAPAREAAPLLIGLLVLAGGAAGVGFVLVRRNRGAGGSSTPEAPPRAEPPRQTRRVAPGEPPAPEGQPEGRRFALRPPR